MTNTEIIDCTTCKYGYEDEQLGIPTCHHPKRFSEDCVDFNMHEEKHLEDELDKSLEEAAEEYSKRVSDGHNYRDLTCGFIAGAKWMAGQGEVKEHFVIGHTEESHGHPVIVCYPESFEIGDKVIVQIRKKED